MMRCIRDGRNRCRRASRKQGTRAAPIRITVPSRPASPSCCRLTAASRTLPNYASGTSPHARHVTGTACATSCCSSASNGIWTAIGWTSSPIDVLRGKAYAAARILGVHRRFGPAGQNTSPRYFGSRPPRQQTDCCTAGDRRNGPERSVSYAPVTAAYPSAEMSTLAGHTISPHTSRAQW